MSKVTETCGIKGRKGTGAGKLVAITPFIKEVGGSAGLETTLKPWTIQSQIGWLRSTKLADSNRP